MKNLPFIENREPRKSEYDKSSEETYLCTSGETALVALRQYTEITPDKITDMIVLWTSNFYRLIMWVSPLSESNLEYLNFVRKKTNLWVIHTMEYRNKDELIARYWTEAVRISDFLAEKVYA